MPPALRDVQPLLAHVAAHLEDDVSLSALAAQAKMSPFHLHRTFSAIAGETPKQFTLRLRLGRAAVLLLTTEKTVLDVALDCGFQSHEAFCRAFRRRFGMTPRSYRDRGFAGGAARVQARDHAELVNRVGPCIGLYHMSPRTEYKENNVPYSITKQKLTQQPILLVRRRVKRSEIASAIGEALPRIFLHAQQHGIPLSGHPFTRYVEMGPGLVTMEPGMRIAGSGENPAAVDPAWGLGSEAQAAGEGEVVVGTLPAGMAATTTHMGSYDRIQDAYGAIQQWMETEGLVPDGAPWESYITDPAEHPDPKDWKTEVFWPLARGSE